MSNPIQTGKANGSRHYPSGTAISKMGSLRHITVMELTAIYTDDQQAQQLQQFEQELAASGSSPSSTAGRGGFDITTAVSESVERRKVAIGLDQSQHENNSYGHCHARLSQPT